MVLETRRRMTVDEFLALPEEKPYKELIAGEVVEKPMPNRNHGKAVFILIGLLFEYLSRSPEGEGDTEVRRADRSEDWVYLPDIAVTLKGRLPANAGGDPGPVEVPADFAIEVLSPDDRRDPIAQRVEFYMRTGTSLLWLVDPQRETITVHEPGQPPRVLRAGDVADARPVLRDFHLDLASFFARVRGEG